MGELVTIGITAFNASSTVERAVRSAVAQNWQPVEIVVVDDCSEDDTRTIVANLPSKYPGVRVFRQPTNQGMAAALNKILSEARGEFLAIFDDDDESLPERITVQYARIVTYERDFAGGAPVLCHAARVQIYPDGSKRVVPTIGQVEGRLAPAGLPVVERILLGKRLKDGYGACAACSQMARLSTYKLVDGFDLTLRRHSDMDLNIRLAVAGAHFVGIARPLVVQTMTKGREKTLEKEYHHTLVLIRKHRDLIDQLGEYKFCLRWIHAKQAWLEGRLGDFIRMLTSLAFSHPVSTMARLLSGIPNFGLNRAFSRFHLKDES